MLLLLLIGCGEDTCDRVESAVADDAPLGDLDYTAGDVADAVVGSWTLQATDAGGAAVSVDLAIARVGATATFEDATLRQRLDGDDVNPFVNEYDIGVDAVCQDVVRLRVRATLRADAVGVDVEVDGDALASGLWGTALSAVSIDGELPTDASTLPPPPEGAAGARVSANAAEGEIRTLLLAWDVDGSTEPILRFEGPYAEVR